MTAQILIADDNDVIRGCISELVEAHDGWNVCAQVENGKQAVLKATELKPDLVILDMAMPVMNGIEAAGEIGKVMPSMRIVLYTVYNLPVLELKAKKAGVRQFVPKPDGAGLVRAVENLLKEQSEEPESL